MDFIAETIARGGPFTTAALVLTLLSLPFALLLGGLTAVGKRIPVVAWVLPVVALFGTGLLGAVQSIVMVNEVVATANPDSVAALSAAGASSTAVSAASGLFASTLYLLVSTMVAGLAGFFANRSAATSNRKVALAVFATGLVGTLAVLACAVVFRFGGSSIVSGAGLAIGMCFVGLGAWRRSDTNTVRDAEARLSTSTSLFLMLYSSALLGHIWSYSSCWQAVAFSPAEQKMTAAAHHIMGAQASLYAGALATLVGLALVAISIADHRQALRETRLWLSMAAVVGLVVTMGAAHAGVYMVLADIVGLPFP